VNELRVGLLGPLVVTADGRQVGLTTGRLRTLLAVLALSAGTPVTLERLADAVWGEDLPANPRRGIQTYLSRLRQIVGAAAIAAGPSGYTLAIAPDKVDVLRFERALDEVARAGDTVTERRHLDFALGLWRGEPFADIRSPQLHESVATHLVERYLMAVERRVDLDLLEGKAADVIGELSLLIPYHPLRESLYVRLLRALADCGRHAEALTRYESVRLCVAEQLGVDPGSELRGRVPGPAA
jgi:DNA-binding SARP family transcriptional activator